jgi:serine/threonine protein kinase
MPNPDPAPETNPAVSRIGRFYVTRELGRGSIGTVYLAHDPTIDRAVAIKTFSARVTALEKRQYEQQFLNEARTTGRLSHPNIVTIYDASSEGGTTFIAMEYLQGRELNKMLDNGHQFAPDDVASIMWKVADALDYAHKNGVIHRDVKPANIFMTSNNQPKVVDFGIARSPNRMANEPIQNDRPYTLFHNNLLGTPNYMSPEQAMGRAVDTRTDVYSLGAVMYEMLTGRKPFQSSDRDQLLQAIAHKAPSSPHEVNPKIPVALSEIVMKAMSKRPDKRFQSAEEMGLKIKRYLTHERRVRRQVQKHVSEPVQTAPAKPPADQSRIFWLGGSAIAVALATAYLVWLR